MLIEIPQGKGRGRWQRYLVNAPGNPDDGPRHWSALVWCPDCGRVLDARNHTTADSGQVSPSLGHPESYQPCGWHVHPLLLGWAPLPEMPPLVALTSCANCSRQTRSLGGWGTWGNPGVICPGCRVQLYGSTSALPSQVGHG